MGRLTDRLQQQNIQTGRLSKRLSLSEKPSNPIKDFFIGAGKGVLSTARGVGELGYKLRKRIVKATTPKEKEEEALKKVGTYKPLAPSKSTTPVGTAQKIGFGAEQIGEFMIPVGQAKAVTKLDDVIRLAGLGKKATGALKLTGRSAVSGAEFAGKTALQTGGDSGETKIAGAIGLATPPTLAGLKKAAPVVGDITASVLAQMIGKEPAHIKVAFMSPKIVANKISQKIIPLQVREKAVKALGNYRQQISQQFSSSLSQIQKQYVKTTKSLGLKNAIEVTGLPSIFRKYGIAVELKGTKLNFDKLNSSIVKSGEKKNLQMVFDTIRNQKDFSPKGIQRVAERINALSEFAFGKGTKTSRVISSIHNKYSDFIKQIYPELSTARAEYGTSKEIIKGIDDILKSIKNEKADPTKVTTSVRKLSNVFKEDNEAYLYAIKRLEQISGRDLLKDLAASEFQNIAPQSFGSRIAQAGLLTGGLFYNPLIIAAMPLFSPRAIGKLSTTAGRAYPFTKEAIKVSPKVITPLLRSNNETPLR